MAHGYAPYQESAFKAALRLAGVAAQGAAQGEGQSFIGGLGGGFGQSMQRADAARMAAQQYAMKQQEHERRTEEAENKARYMEALTERAKKPPKESKPEKATKDAEAIRILGRPLTEQEKQKLAGVYIAPKAPGKGSKPAKAPAAPKPRAAVMKRIDAINGADVNDPAQRAVLQRILANPPTQEEAAAADKKLRVPGTTAYRR